MVRVGTVWNAGSIEPYMLADRVQQFLLDSKFSEIRRHGDSNSMSWQEVRGTKAGVLRTMIGGRVSVHVVIRRGQNKLEVSMDTGEHGKNALAAMLTSGVGLVGIVHGRRLTDRLWSHIMRSIDGLAGYNTRAPVGTADAAPDAAIIPVYPPISSSVMVRHGRRVVVEHRDGIDKCDKKSGRGPSLQQPGRAANGSTGTRNRTPA